MNNLTLAFISLHRFRIAVRKLLLSAVESDDAINPRRYHPLVELSVRRYPELQKLSRAIG